MAIALTLPTCSLAKPYDYLLATLANNDEYQAALTSIEIMDKSVNVASSALLPQVRGSLSYRLNNITDNRERNGQNQDRDNAQLSVTQQIFDPGSKAEVTVAEFQLELVRQQAKLVRQQALLATYQAYLEASLAQERLELLKRQRNNLFEQRNVATSRFEVGQATLLPVLNVKAELANLLADQLTASNDLTIALDNLHHLTGGSDTQILPLRDLPPLPDMPLEGWLAQAENAPMVRINASRIDIQLAVEDQLLATILPTVSAIGNTDLKGTERIGLEMSVPIFSSGGATAGIERARLQTRGLTQTQESLQGEAQLAVNSAWRNLNVQVLRRDALTASVDAERERLNLALASVELEAGVLADALDAAATLAAAELQLAQARHSQLTAWLNLLAATGNLSLNQLQQLEGLFG